MDGDTILISLVAFGMFLLASAGVHTLLFDGTAMYQLASTCEEYGFIQNENYRIECSVAWKKE